MKTLQQLTLSNNKIRVIEGVGNLVNLEKIVLFHNEIETMEGLEGLANNSMNKLKVLDLRGNRLGDLGELRVMTGFGRMEEVMMDVGKASNPMCENKQEYRRMLMKHLPQSVKVIVW